MTSSQFNQALDNDPPMQTLKKRGQSTLTSLRRQRLESSREFAKNFVVDANIMFESYRADFKQQVLQNWRLTTNTAIAPSINISSVRGIEPTTRFGFSFLSTATGTSLTIPYWCLVLLSGTFAALFGLRWRIRFSLRTVLIATTLAAIVLGIVTTKHK